MMDVLTSLPAGVVSAAAAVLAFGVLWRLVFKPTFKRINEAIITTMRIGDVLPIVFEMAEEFRPNGGAKLRDSVDRIESEVKALRTHVECEFVEYQHNSNHAIKNAITAVEARLTKQIRQSRAPVKRTRSTKK